jgi:hypothetical protein
VFPALNTVYVGPKQSLPLLKFGEWEGGTPSDVKFFNNLFIVDGNVSYEWGLVKNVVFAHNAFCGHHAEIPPARSPSKAARHCARRATAAQGSAH